MNDNLAHFVDENTLRCGQESEHGVDIHALSVDELLQVHLFVHLNLSFLQKSAVLCVTYTLTKGP